jgi:hypothetical protein
MAFDKNPGASMYGMRNFNTDTFDIEFPSAPLSWEGGEETRPRNVAELGVVKF